jgi:hypothetical protein
MEVIAMADRGWTGVIRYGLPGLILGLVLCKWMGGQELQAQATPPGSTQTASIDRSRSAPANDPSGTIAFTTNVPGSVTGSQLLYLIDTKSRAFAIYRVEAPNNAKGSVKLEAARQYQWDLKLSDYNNLGLQPTDIETAVRAGGSTKR